MNVESVTNLVPFPSFTFAIFPIIFIFAYLPNGALISSLRPNLNNSFCRLSILCCPLPDDSVSIPVAVFSAIDSHDKVNSLCADFKLKVDPLLMI